MDCWKVHSSVLLQIQDHVDHNADAIGLLIGNENAIVQAIEVSKLEGEYDWFSERIIGIRVGYYSKSIENIKGIRLDTSTLDLFGAEGSKVKYKIVSSPVEEMVLRQLDPTTITDSLEELKARLNPSANFNFVDYPNLDDLNDQIDAAARIQKLGADFTDFIETMKTQVH